MLTAVSKEHFHISGRNVRSVPKDMIKSAKDAALFGVGVKSPGVAREMAQQAYAYAADSIQGNVTTPAIPGYIQFLQNWLPGLVTVITAARKIDELTGLSTIGSWEDEQALQRVLEMTGYAVPYGDYTNVPLSDWNMVTVPRTVVRMELGMRVGVLEEMRSAREGVNDSQWKRESCGSQLEISRNLIGFNGYNAGNNNTYGFLNDPGLPAYVNVAASGSGSSMLWSSKTFLNICADIRTGVVALQNQSQDNINPEDTETVLAVATNAYGYLSVTSDFGISVRDWIKTNYPKMRIVSAPQLNTANGGSGVFYLYAERFSDASTDSGRVWEQIVPTKFMVLGVQKLAKAYEEDYANATAGCMLKRPFAVVRYSGIS
jgi:hypothetical protein